MKFKFSLDSVLKVRTHEKKLQKQKLAEEVAKKQEIAQLKEDIKDKLRSYLDGEHSEEIQNIQQIRQRSAHIQQVHQRMKKLSDELSNADAKVSKAREELANAHKDLHVIEKAREFEKAIFDENMARKEQKFLDEVATQSYSR